MNIRKLIVTGVLFLGLILPKSVLAGCSSFGFAGPDANPPAESCQNIGSGGSYGVAVYSCADYGGLIGYGCYWHEYVCDANCSGNGMPGGGGSSYTFPTCDGGKSLSCASPSIDSCMAHVADCGDRFPSGVVSFGCNGVDTNLTCQTNCACCSAGNVLTCDSGTYSYTYTSYSTRILGDGSIASVDTHSCAGSTDAYVATTRGPNKIKYDANGNLISAEYTSTCKTCGCSPSCSATAPTGLSAVSGPTVGSTASVTWTPGSGGTTQHIYVTAGATPISDTSLTSSDNSELITGLTPLTTYTFRVVTEGGSCSQEASTTFTTPASTAVISGQLYLDTNNDCSRTTPWTGGGVAIAIDALPGVGINPVDGIFGFNADVNSSHQLAISIPNGYICSTAAGCDTCSRTGIISPSSNNYFYLTSSHEAWWQSVGGGIYAGSTAGGVSIRSQLPYAATNLVTAGSVGGTGAVLRASGTVDTGVGSVSSAGYNGVSSYKGKTMNYAYFAAQMGLLQTSPTIVSLDAKPVVGPDFYYKAGDSTLGSSWSVANGEKYVIFVNGDLRINADITVAKGGYLAFIVKGKVTVDPSVTAVEGIYVMDSDFVTESAGAGSDVQLNIAGSVVAWGTMTLGRDLGSGNLSGAAEKFSYRPDLIANMSDKMKSFAMQWQEVPAGTFGN